MLDLAVIILTKDEELHIERCIKNILKLEPKQVFIVDSFSTDKTVEISKKLNTIVIQHSYPGTQAQQFNWALDNCPINSNWILRLDADEYLDENTISEVRTLLPTLNNDISSLSMRRFCVWQGKRIKYGMNSVILKRFFRFGVGRCENKFMDEHIVTNKGDDLLLKGFFVDENLKDISFWTDKHVDYALREAIDLLNLEYNLFENQSNFINKRKEKQIYSKLPLFFRAFVYFIYRYIFKLGFLDGKEGFLWHFLQGWWYRTLVDVKVLEIKKKAKLQFDKEDRTRLLSVIENSFKIKI